MPTGQGSRVHISLSPQTPWNKCVCWEPTRTALVPPSARAVPCTPLPRRAHSLQSTRLCPQRPVHVPAHTQPPAPPPACARGGGWSSQTKALLVPEPAQHMVLSVLAVWLAGWIGRWMGGWGMDGGWVDRQQRTTGQDPAPPCLPRDARGRCLEAQEPPALWTGAHVLTAQLLPDPPAAGGDRVHHHPVQLHVQQQLCRGHEPAAHPHHHYLGDAGVSLPDAGVGGGIGAGTWARASGALAGETGRP